MNSVKKGEGVPLLNFEGGPVILLLNFEGGSGVPLLNFKGVPGPTFKLWGGPGVLVPLLHYAYFLKGVFFFYYFFYLLCLFIFIKTQKYKIHLQI